MERKEVSIGSKYGDWTVIDKGKGKYIKRKKAKKEYLKRTWLCECGCGYCNNTRREVLEENLISHRSNGCGKKSKIQNGKNNKKYNLYDLTKEYGVGYTSNGIEFYFDLDDYNKIKNYCWHLHKDGYLRTRINRIDNKNIYILMHNLIMGFVDKSGKYVIDHINNKPNDNRKSNLRICLHKENMRNRKLCKNNTSGFKGIHYSNIENKWKAYINYDGKRINLGTYKNIEDAVKARKEAEEKYFGEFNYKGCEMNE